MDIHELILKKCEAISQLKAKLYLFDHERNKYIDGDITEEEYAPIREQCKAWRAEIHALRAEIAEIKASKEA